MARAEHASVQGDIRAEIDSFRRKEGPGGWWIMTEINVRYNERHCPVHDLAGWRKERVPQKPRGIMEITPDWVCEIVSPGHEKKDTVYNFITLQQYKVPYYWLIWPEDKVLIAYKLAGTKYSVIETIAETIKGGGKYRIEPFDTIEFDLGYIFA
jgi:Uma2 family endonuclease